MQQHRRVDEFPQRHRCIDVVVVSVGQHDGDYVDAFYGPAEWRAQAEAAKMKIDAEPTSGEELQKIIERMYATPKDVVERVRKAMGR